MGIFRSRQDDSSNSADRSVPHAAYFEPGCVDERDALLEQLFRQHASRVLDYARNRGATLTEAEDVVSEVFIVLTRRLSDAPLAPDQIIPWLLGVARKVIGNQLRGSRRREALTERSAETRKEREESQRDFAAATADALLIRQGLARLPEKEREALLLVTWDGFRYEEAALILECSPGAVAQRVLRARRLLEETSDIRTYRNREERWLRSMESREE
jgi:RNA polymerase sigma factor (sigma-70 family)